MINRTLSATIVFLFCMQNTAAAEECGASGGLNYICGPKNAEDLVLVPHTRWVLSSGMLAGGGIYLIDSAQKTWSQLYAEDSRTVRQDMKIYGACPGAPDPMHLETHGLNIRPGENGHSTLYVVGHGGREAIEVFAVDAAEEPRLTWIGCVPMPEGLAANSVASFADGALVATVLMHPDKTFADMFAGRNTGAVYEWSPGESGFTLIIGTELPGNNGIEISADEKEIFVVSTGLRTVVSYSRSNPARQLRTTRVLEIIPDNLHTMADGRLLTAGTIADSKTCGPLDFANQTLEEFAACPRGFMATAIDTKTMEDTHLAEGEPNPVFSNATMALQVGDEIWIGTFSGDRIGIARE